MQRRYNERIQKRLTKTTWMSGCSSWYLTKDGFNASMYPGFATQYLRQMRDFRFGDYDAVAREATACAPCHRRPDMSSARQPRQPAGAISTILVGLRRAPRQIRRGSRDVIENAVSQLFDAAVQPHGVAASGEYRIDELARLAGTTTRNIRVYRDRGLLHPPLRVGRIALFNDTHLTRLRLITSLLDRGYNISHVHEMLTAWEQGKDVGDMLGLEIAIAGSWATEKPERMSVADAKRLVDDDAGFERMVGLGVIKLEDGEAIVVRPKLIEAFNEIRQYGVATSKLVDVHEQVAPLIDQISGILVQAGVEEVIDRLKPGAALPPDTEVAELITMLVRFRTQAVSAVSRDAGVLDRVDASSRRSVRFSAISSRRKPTRTRRRTPDHSHSMVPGGLLVTSSTTRLTSGTSLVIRVEMRSSTS